MSKIKFSLIAAILLVVFMLSGCGNLDNYTHNVTGLADGEECHRKLLLQDDISVKFFFSTDDAPESVLYDGDVIPVIKELDGRFAVIIPNISPADFDKAIRFDFGHIKVDTSVLAYIRDCLETEENPAIRSVVKSLYKSYLRESRAAS